MHSLPLLASLQGFIAPGEKQVLKFSYMPGVPGPFSRTFQLKGAELDPDNIYLKGEASFPMITVNLPWNIEGGHCPSAPRRGPSGFVPYHMHIG